MWLDLLVVSAIVVVAIFLFAPPLWPADIPESGAAESKIPRTSGSAYILPTLIHHARILPREAAHAFRYPTLHLAVRLDALEKGLLDRSLSFSRWLPALSVFAWRGSGALGKQTPAITAMHPDGYGRRAFPGINDAEAQTRVSKSVYLKLLYELQTRGFLSSTFDVASLKDDAHDEDIGQVWAVTMPSLLGMGGFNPLTVYYVYRRHESGDINRRGPLWLAVLEVHNTFSERHIYVCEVGQQEDEEGRKGYDHVWTFPRAFHVSPFNDRAGYYRLLLRQLWPSEEAILPTLDVKLLLLVEEEEEGETKTIPAAVTAEHKGGNDTPLSSSSYDIVEDVAAATSRSTPEKKKLTLHKKLMASLASATVTTPEDTKSIDSSTVRPNRRPVPLTSSNMLLALAYQPFDLVLPTMRIMVEAAKLHWRKRLPVYMRPEPDVDGIKRGSDVNASGLGWPSDSNPIENNRREKEDDDAGTTLKEGEAGGENSPMKIAEPRRSGTTLWAEQGWMEAATRQRVLDYARWKTLQLTSADAQSFTLRILAKDPETPSIVVEDGEVKPLAQAFLIDGNGPQTNETTAEKRKARTLTIYTTSPAFYMDMGLYGNADLAFLFGARAAKRWGVSDVDDYRAFFSNMSQLNRTHHEGSTLARSLVNRIRKMHLRWCLSLDDHESGKDQSDATQILSQILSEKEGQTSVIDDIFSPTWAFVAALLLWHISLRALVLFSNLLNVRYVRKPWIEVQEGLDILRMDNSKTSETPS